MKSSCIILFLFLIYVPFSANEASEISDAERLYCSDLRSAFVDAISWGFILHDSMLGFGRGDGFAPPEFYTEQKQIALEKVLYYSNVGALNFEAFKLLIKNQATVHFYSHALQVVYNQYTNEPERSRRRDESYNTHIEAAENEIRTTFFRYGLGEHIEYCIDNEWNKKGQ